MVSEIMKLWPFQNLRKITPKHPHKYMKESNVPYGLYKYTGKQ